MPKTTSKITPCILCGDQAEQVAAFYLRAFGNGRVTATSHYPEASDNPGGMPKGSVLAVELELAGQPFTLVNGGPAIVPNPSISFFVNVDSRAQADRLFSNLADGGKALMPIDSYPWSERYGWVQDRFQVSWQVMAGRRSSGGATIVPCFMFAGKQRGEAERAMRLYVEAFPGGRIDRIERYTADEGPEGAVKHGRFVIAGQEMVAMDSHVAHDISFNEGVSLQVHCQDQAELDHYWQTLAAGGEHSFCGWLKDRFGLSWQAVPAELGAWMTSGDVKARDRTFAAMLTMRKLDIAALARAFAGK